MSIDHAALKRSLRILAENPKKIKEAEKLYSDRLTEIKAKEASGNWSPNTIAKEKAEARQARDRVTSALAHSMRSALETVKQNNNLAEQPLDINSPKIQNAVNVLSLMGKNLTFADQASLLESFRGDPASLRFLESAFKKNGLDYAAKQAAEMYRGIPEQAIKDMETVLNFHDYHESKGEYSFPAERMMWTHGEFQRQLDRMGYEVDTTDPFYAALDDAASYYTGESSDPLNETYYKLVANTAKAEIAKCETDPTTAFNKAIKHMEDRAAYVTANAAEA